jgi:exonuclease VII small subunit
MQKSRKVHPFEKRLRLLEEAQERMKQKMDETDGEDLEERVSDLESNYKDLDSRHETWIRGMRSCIRGMSSSARRWKITRVSCRMRTPASMISRAKSGSSNHRGARSG